MGHRLVCDGETKALAEEETQAEVVAPTTCDPVGSPRRSLVIVILSLGS